MKTSVIRARIEPSLKQSVETILTSLGLTASQTIHMLYRQIEMGRGLPFDVRIPNAVTRAAMDEPSDRLPRYRSTKKLFDDLEK